jgi:transposase
MLALSGQSRIFLYGEPTDMRKGFEGLCCIVEHLFPEELLTGALFAFLNRRRDRIKVLYWDTDGLAIWYKRLEKGSYQPSKIGDSLMDRREFFLLLEGIIPQRMQRRHKVS